MESGEKKHVCSLGSGERFVAHAAADGGRWPGLCGGCDRSGIPLLLSNVTADGHYMGRMRCYGGRCSDSLLGASLYVRCSYWVEMISSPWPESMCLQGRGNNVGDTVIPLIYNVSNSVTLS